jgi:hypothetical protein
MSVETKEGLTKRQAEFLEELGRYIAKKFENEEELRCLGFAVYTTDCKLCYNKYTGQWYCCG